MKWLVLLLVPFFGVAQENARILERTTTYVLEDDGTATITDDYRIKVNSKEGERHGVYFNFFDKHRKITDISVDIYNSKGDRVRRLKRNDGQEFGFNASYEITDAKVLVIYPDYQDYPFTLAVSSTVKLQGFVALQPWTPRDEFNVAVDKSVLRVKYPKSLKVKFHEQNIKGIISEDARYITTTYEVAKLPHVERKHRYRDFYDAQASVWVSPENFTLGDSRGSNASWIAFGEWFLDLNDKPFELTPETKKFLDGLDKKDLRQFVRLVYQYMQDKTRYVSIQLGIGGFQSLPTEEVEKFGYGDCKALSTYMRNMLKYAGVSSNYVLAMAGRDARDVKAEFVSSQFNHVFLAIPLSSDTIMLECTSQTMPSDFIGTFTDDRNVLWVDKNRSRIVRSRTYDHRDNEKRSMVKIAIDKNGDATAKFNVENRGIFFDEIMIYQNATGDHVKDHNIGKFTYKDFVVNDFSFNQPSRSEAVFNANYMLTVPGLGRGVGDKLIIPNVPVIPLNEFFSFDDLAAYASVRRGITLIDEIEIDLPQGHWIYNKPDGDLVESKFGTYKLTTEIDGTRLKVRREVILYKGDYTGSVFPDFRAFHQQVEKIENRKLVLNGKT